MKFDHEHYWPLAYNDVWKEGDEINVVNENPFWVALLPECVGQPVRTNAINARRPKPKLYVPIPASTALPITPKLGFFPRMWRNFWNLIKEIEEHQLR